MTKGDSVSEGTKTTGRSRAKATPQPEPIQEAPTTIRARLAEIRSRVSHVEKNGEHGQGYSFAQWQDVIAAVRAHLDELHLHLHLSVRDVTVLAPGNMLVTLDYEWQATDTDETLGGVWAGQGWDKGDKALNKAYTGALKYLVLDTFLIPTGDDPEAGDQPPSDGSAAPRSGGRQTVARIPRERAERIVAQARDAGLSQQLFEAKLHELGFSRVVDLSVDAAEGMEAFIAAGAKS